MTQMGFLPSNLVFFTAASEASQVCNTDKKLVLLLKPPASPHPCTFMNHSLLPQCRLHEDEVSSFFNLIYFLTSNIIFLYVDHTVY